MAVTNILNGTIEEITPDRNSTLVTVSYRERFQRRGEEKRIRMAVGSRTVVVNSNSMIVPAEELRIGMKINAIVSSVMTRSVPLQAEAFFIEILKEAPMNNMIQGRILDVDRENRSFTTISDGNFSSIIRFNVPENTPVLDRNGNNINFARLLPGMRVEVRHENFMTASIPPQTTALEVKVL